MDPWPHSEAGRFHRRISLCVALIGALILAAEVLRNHASLELAVLGAALLVVGSLAPSRGFPQFPRQLPGAPGRA